MLCAGAGIGEASHPWLRQHPRRCCGRVTCAALIISEHGRSTRCVAWTWMFQLAVLSPCVADRDPARRRCLNCIGGLDHASEGRIWFEGSEVTSLPERDWVRLHRHRIGFIFQAHALMANYSAAENIDLALRLAGVRGRERYRRTDEVLSLMGLTRWADHRTFEMSGGQRQRVAIARAIAPKPAMLLADEPTGELDTATGQQILRIFRQAADLDGLAVIIATHDLSVDAYADQVYHLQDGRIV